MVMLFLDRPLAEFQRKVEEIFPEILMHYTVFGSRARGDAAVGNFRKWHTGRLVPAHGETLIGSLTSIFF